MEPLGINGYPNLTKLLTEEFIDGIKPGARKRSPEEVVALNGIIKKMTKYYTWNKNNSIFERSSQNCSDMLIHVGKEPILINFNLLFDVIQFFHSNQILDTS